MKNLITLPKETPQGMFLKNVVILKDRQYSKSYNTAIQDEFKFDFGRVEGKWIHVWNAGEGYAGKHLTNAIHFRGFFHEKLTTLRGFNMSNTIAAKKIEKIKAQRQAEFDRIAEANELAQKQKAKAKQEAAASIDDRIQEVIDEIKCVVSKERIERRLSGIKTNNEPCNKAVGVVGYHYATSLGWINVLEKINQYYV